MSFISEISGRTAEKEIFKLVEKQNRVGEVESTLRCSLWNVRSINNKLAELMEHLVDRESDIVFLTETWLQCDTNSITAEIKTYGYKLLHDRRKDRAKETGGGVGVMIKIGLAAKQQPAKHYESFEHTVVYLSLPNKKKIILISIYRVLFVAEKVFLSDLAELFDEFVVSNEHFIIAGDVNIHVETADLYARQFDELLDLYDLKQHVSQPTHTKGHTLDVVLTPNRENYLNGINISTTDLSDHFLVDFNLNVERKLKQSKIITYRPTKTVDMVKFCEDVTDKLGALPPTNDVGKRVKDYNEVLGNLVEEYSPLKTVTIKLVPEARWFDKDYVELRKLRRSAEQRYRRTSREADKKMYIALRKQAIDTSFVKKKNYVREKLKENSGSLYSVVNKLIDNEREVILPKASSNKELANNFLVFFKEKIEKIRSTFTPSPQRQSTVIDANIVKLTEFEPATLDEIIDIAKSNGVKCSPEDPVPASLLSPNIETFAPFWLEIVNLSLQVGSMDSMVDAVILPAIKELNSLIDTENYKNYRPLSNLVFIGKLIERVVQKRLNQHLVRNKLVSNKNYAYEQDHSTELLLLKVVDDLYKSFDNNLPSVVVLLDLSAAFDTVDHTKLLDILKNEIGIEGTALKWFKSFLIGRTQKVKIGDEYSEILELLFGVAQGSVLGPPLFKIYIRSLYKYVEPTKFSIEGFADDHQLIKQFMICLQQKALGEDIQNLLSHIAVWMNEYFLCLNQGKTKILVIAPPSVQPEIIIRGVFIQNVCIRFVKTAKNLGIILDNELSFECQINKVVKGCYATIKKLSQIKGYLSEEELKQLVSSSIFSLMDYCNALYYGINVNLIMKLQRVQNCAARLVSKTKIPSGGMDEVLLKMHWLKVKFRCVYKILLIT
jgi:exonuclease III